MLHEIKKIKVMTVFGTRPEIIRLSRVFAALDEHVRHIMVHTGQSYDYEMNEIFFRDLEIRKPDYFLEVKAASLGDQIANIIGKSERVFRSESPDALLVLGDTNSTLSAIIAKRMGIPIFHMEAGNRCFDEAVPEEINRRIVDHISDINLPYSEHARQYLLREGIHPAKIFMTGSPMSEVLSHYREKIESSGILAELGLKKENYILASLHREENVDAQLSLEMLLRALGAVCEQYGMPVIVSTHPRTAQRMAEFGLSAHPLVTFHKPFGYFDYNHLQTQARIVLSDSGTIFEESSILGFPAVQVRNSSERPEAFDEGVAILSGLDAEHIIHSIETTLAQKEKGGHFHVPRAYCDTNVSDKVMRIILSNAKKARGRV